MEQFNSSTHFVARKVTAQLAYEDAKWKTQNRLDKTYGVDTFKRHEFKSVFQLKTYKSAFDVHKVQLPKLVTLSAVDTKQLSTWSSIQPVQIDKKRNKQKLRHKKLRAKT